MFRFAPLLLVLGCSDIPDGADEAVVACTVSHSDPFTLANARVEANRLELDVSYTGGCRAQDWYTCWDGLFEENDPESFSEANPPRFNVFIGHDDNGDNCDTDIEAETYRFNLLTVKEAYESTHDNGANRLVIVVEGTTVQYPFPE